MTPEAVADLLRARGCSITGPRRAILEFLCFNETHPTAAEVFLAVTETEPQASRATVYNTLGLLSELGVIRAFRVGESETRFDPNTAFHHHLVCPACGAISDLGAEQVEVRVGGAIAPGARVQLDQNCLRCPA